MKDIEIIYSKSTTGVNLWNASIRRYGMMAYSVYDAPSREACRQELMEKIKRNINREFRLHTDILRMVQNDTNS